MTQTAIDRTAQVIHKMLVPHAPVRKAVADPAQDMSTMSDKVLLLKINSLEDKIDKLTALSDELTSMVNRLLGDRYPRYVGTSEACKILGISGTTMDKRLKAGYYNFAVKENGRWRFPLAELYRFQGML